MPKAARSQANHPEELFLVSDLKAFLEGMWKLERSLEDGLRDETGALIGEARFVTADGGLDYREEGMLSLGAHSGAAHQAYRYDFPTPGRAAVSFTDGRFFHDLDLTAGIWTCRHRCGDDDYAGEFRALNADLLRVLWRVKGPRKDMLLDGLYRRVG